MKQLVLIIILAVVVSVFFTATAWAITGDSLDTQVRLNAQEISQCKLGMTKLETTLAGINEKLDQKIDRLANRPSWITTVAITFFSSTTLALLVNSIRKK